MARQWVGEATILQTCKVLNAYTQGIKAAAGATIEGEPIGAVLAMFGEFGHGLVERLSAPTFAPILAWMLSIKYSKGWKHERTIKA